MRVLLAFLLTCATVQAGAWQVAGNGYYVNGDGWFYTRQCSPGYWYCGKYYAGTCSYTRVVQQQAPVQYSANWKSEMIAAVAKQRDTELFVQALSQSGLAPKTSAVASVTYQQGTYADQGATVYANTVKSYAPNIGQVDIQANIQMLGRLAEQLGKGTDDAVYGISSLVGQVATAQTEALKIQEAGRVAVALAAVTSPSKTVTTQYRAEASSQTQASTVPAYSMVRAQTLLDQACVKCHGPQDPKGGLSLHDFATWPSDKLAEFGPKIMAHVTSHDPETQMPPPESGIKPLSPVELRLLYSVIPEEVSHAETVRPSAPPAPPVPDDPGRAGAAGESQGPPRQ